MDIAVLEQAKDVWFDKIVEIVNTIQLPDLYGDKNHFLEGNHFYLNQRTSDVTITPDVANNAIVLKCNKLSGEFINDSFRYKETIFIAKGHLKVEIDTVEIQFGIRFENEVLPDGRTVPKIAGVDIISDIDRYDVDIKIYGNIWSDFASAFEVFFVGTVVDLINDTITTALQTDIPQFANGYIDKTDGYAPLDIIHPYFDLDWSTANAAEVTDSYFGIGLRGLFFDSQIGEELPTTTIPEMPLKLADHPEKFQAFVSTFALDTFFSAFLETGKIGAWLDHSVVPASAPVQLTSGDLNTVFPGMSDYYGADAPVDVHFTFSKIGDFSVVAEDSEMGGVATMNMDFWVTKADGTYEMATSVTLQDTSFGFSALVNAMNLSMQVVEVNSSKVIINSCTFGTLSAYKLKLELNNFFRFFLGPINTVLANHPVAIPSTVANLFELQDLTLSYFDDYIYAGATPVFIGPQLVEAAIM